MKRRKLGLIFNIVAICLSVCAIAIGIYSLTTSSLTINGSVGFTAHECRVYVSGYMYGHADTSTGAAYKEPKNDAEKRYLTYSGNKKATDEDPMIVSNNNQSLSFNIAEGNGVYFSSEVFDNTIKPIVIVLRVANATQNMVLVKDKTVVGTSAQYEVTCNNSAYMLYADEDDKSTIITYKLLPKKDNSGNYVQITTPVAVNLSVSFEKYEDISKEGFTLDSAKKTITNVPATQNGGTDLLIIPSKFSDDNTVYTTFGEEYIYVSSENVRKYTKIILLKGITTISQFSFYVSNSLKSIVIPNSVQTIGQYAFKDCNLLTSITTPQNVTTIDHHAFSGCSALISASILGCKNMGANLFEGCTKLTSITFGNGVTNIGERSLISCTWNMSVTIPNSVTSIKNNAFSGSTGITSITIPGSVTSIEEYAFKECSGLKSLIVEYGTTSIGEYAFSGCTSLDNIIIPSSVTSVGTDAFRNVPFLTNLQKSESKGIYTCSDGGKIALQVPVDITSIDLTGVYYIVDSALLGCTKLNSVTMSNSLKFIGKNAFFACEKLTAITIPNSVTSIGAGAFTNCKSLTTTIGSGWKKLSDNTSVTGTTKLKDISYDIVRS